MAMDENPTVKEGQSWSSWADIVGFRNSDNEEEEEDAGKEKNWKKRRENDAMKLRKEEMGLFGYCPTWDDFFLVVCELCGRVVKPQAFSGHLECRHGNSSCHGSRDTSASSSNPQPQSHHGSNKNSNSGGHTSASNAPSQQQRGSNSTFPLVPSSSSNRSNSSASIYSNQSGAKSSPNQLNQSNNSQSSGSNSKLSSTRQNSNHHNYTSNNNNQSSKLPAARQISTSNNNQTIQSNAKSATARQNSSSRQSLGTNIQNSAIRQNSSSNSSSRQSLAPINHDSKPSARTSNPVPISNTNANSNSGNNTPEHSNTAKSKLEAKSDSKSSKKNHAIIDPVVRVERMPSSVVTKKTTTDSPTSGDRRERSASPRTTMTETNASLDLEHARASPSRNQVLYEGTSGPGPGNLESAQPSVVGQRKIAQSPKSESLKKTNTPGSAVNSREGHAGPMSAPTTGAVNKKPSKSKKSSKERKQLLCKDREYDANKHCGVVIAESGKHCTRSLTCKTHSLSLRRAVIGRKKHFDELLSEHRAAKESQLRNAAPQVAVASRVNPQPGVSRNSDPDKIGSSKGNPSAAIVNLKRVLASGRVSKTTRDAIAPITSTSTHNPHIQRVTSDSHASGNSDAGKSPNSDKYHSGQRSDPPYLSHHPRPAAMCSFGIRRLGCGVFLTNRCFDATRSALEMAFLRNKGANPAPPKKLRADAGSLLPLEDPLMETNDPYGFTRLDLSVVNDSDESEGGSLGSPPIYTNIKAVSHDATASSAKTKPSIVENNTFCGDATPSNLTTESVATSNTSAVKRTSNESKIANAVNKLKRLKSCEEKTINRASSPQIASAAKKRRTSVNSNPNNPSNSNIPPSNNPQTPPLAQTLTLTALTSATVTARQSSRSIPLSFPLTIGERLGALSRLNVNVTSPFVNRNNVSIAPAITRNHLTPNHALKDNVFLTGVDAINGQIPVSSALLHSVTVSRSSDREATTLLTAPASIALAQNSLVNQLSRFRQNLTDCNAHQRELTTNNDKLGADSASASTSGGAKGNKCKSRKSAGSNSGAHLQSQRQSSSGGAYASPLNLALSLSLDGAPGAISGTRVSSTGTALQISSASPTDCSSPRIRMESLSPGMVSPTVNGRGPSPCGNLAPPLTPSKNAFGSGTVTSATVSASNVGLSPASRTNTPSPDSLSTNHFSQHLTKGKSKHSSSYPKAVTPLNVVAAAAQHHSNPSFPATPPLSSSSAAAAAAAGITYQQVFASQMLTQAQLNQLRAFHSPTAVPSKNNKNVASDANSVASIPSKLLAATSSATSRGTRRPHLTLSDDSRRHDLQQDSHSLST